MIPSWMVRAVVSTAFAILFCFGSTSFGADPLLSNSSIVIKPVGSVSPPQAGIGRMAYYPIEKMFANPELLRLNFELSKPDGMTRLNILTFGIEGYVVRNEDILQYWNNTGMLQDFASEGVVYTDESTSPVINNGMLIIPYGADGNIVSQLVGTSIKVTNPRLMDGGSFKVHSDPSIKVYKVKVVGMPFKFDPIVQDIMREAQFWNPDEPLSLNVDVFAEINYEISIEHGCAKYLGFYETMSYCLVHFDGRLKPSHSHFGISMPEAGSLLIPVGALSYLDIQHSTNLTTWNKVDLTPCSFAQINARTSMPPPPDVLKVSGLSTEHAAGYYRLVTRYP